ncbi:hypothetical protein L7F22_066666 [Adiantum nelumboides]|nr:hypothetical protein [Adiantum nelumboides]
MKLAKRYYGPFQILLRINETAYKLKLPANWHIHNAFHVSLLKPLKGDPPTEPVQEEPPLFDDTEEVLVPEEILRHEENSESERLEQAVRDQSPLRARTMGRPPANGGPVFRFLANEVATMEKTLEDFQGNAPSKEAMQGLADAFSISAERAGKTTVQYKQAKPCPF